MAETLIGVPESRFEPPPSSEASGDFDPDAYGEWVVVGGDTEEAALDAEEARFIGPASDRPDEAAPQRNDEAAPQRNGDSGASSVPFQSDMLARIAGELKSIKTELVGLKEHLPAERTVASTASPAATVEAAAPATFTPATAASGAPPPFSSAPSGNALGADRAGVEPVAPSPAQSAEAISTDELRSLLAYLDRLLEALPEEKIDEFARSEYFELYRKVFDRLGLV
ncbi:MAG: hypothetical protein WBH97_03180 [Rectinemataceae bacterium]